MCLKKYFYVHRLYFFHKSLYYRVTASFAANLGADKTTVLRHINLLNNVTKRKEISITTLNKGCGIVIMNKKIYNKNMTSVYRKKKEIQKIVD